jgi:hypothetical protein
MSLLEDVLLRGTRAAQPGAGTVAEGTLYYVTDEGVTEQSRASAWVTYTDTSGNGITQLTGDVTAGPGTGSQAATIANDAVTYAKIQNISATSRILGRRTAGAGDVEENTLTQILDFVGSAAQGDILYRNAADWVRLAAGTSGQLLKTAGAGANPLWADVISTIGITIDGGGSAITTGVKGYIRIPFSGVIVKATMLADQSGSAVVDVWKDTYANYPPVDADSITAAAPPTISAAIKSEDATLTGWTTTVTAGDTFGFNVDSAATITRLTLILDIRRT